MRLLFVDRSTQLQTVVDLDRRARGGMISSLFKITDYLSQRGHSVTVLSDIASEGRTRAGTLWLNSAMGRYDVLVANRGIHDGFPEIDAKARILWTHDLPHNGFIPEPKNIRAFNCTVFMSRYAEWVWRLFYRDIGRSVRIPNGVDKRIFFPRQKQAGYLLYASAPNRGLDKMPLIADAIRSRVSMPIEARAYSKLSELHPNEGPDTFDYRSIDDKSLDLRDPVPHRQFANELGRAGLLILPSGYPEICSNVVLQALASGTPVITTGRLGATPEWVEHGRNGMLTESLPNDYMVHTLEIVRNAVAVLNSTGRHLSMMRKAARTRILTWHEVGSRWERLLNRYA